MKVQHEFGVVKLTPKQEDKFHSDLLILIFDFRLLLHGSLWWRS